jgi:hypothetical protein
MKNSYCCCIPMQSEHNLKEVIPQLITSRASSFSKLNDVSGEQISGRRFALKIFRDAFFSRLTPGVRTAK